MAKKRIKKVIVVVILCVVILTLTFFGALGIGCVYAESTLRFWQPNYAKIDLTPILEKEELSADDYQIIYRQTGLTRLAVDDYLSQDQPQEIIRTQTFFFKKHEVEPFRFAPFTYIDYIDEYAPIAPLKDGDILVSSTTRVSWFRYGHSALVLDGYNGVILESFAPGYNSSLGYAISFADLANFIILRPKVSDSVKAQVVSYAKGNLIDLPYSLTTGIFSKKFPEKLEKTQCAHLVWYAYNKFGIDLDSTGGAVVKPRDIANSNHLEIVQVFGLDLDKLWG